MSEVVDNKLQTIIYLFLEEINISIMENINYMIYVEMLL